MDFKNRILFSLIFFFIVALGFSQDVIIQKNGNRIYCKILGEDSVSIFYNRSGQKAQFEIKKTEVYTYDYGRRGKRDQTPTVPNHASSHSELFLINLVAGVASPLGDFASKDVNSIKSGLAKTGLFFHPSLILKLSKNFGFSVGYRYQSNGFSDDLIASQFIKANPNISFSSSSGSWLVKGFFGGIHLTLPSANISDLSFDFDFSAGVPTCVLPEFYLTANSANFQIHQFPSSTKAVAFLGGAGIKYKFADGVAFNVNLNYLTTKAEFTNIQTNITGSPVSFDNYTQKIATINFQVGFSFLLKGK